MYENVVENGENLFHVYLKIKAIVLKTPRFSLNKWILLE